MDELAAPQGKGTGPMARFAAYLHYQSGYQLVAQSLALGLCIIAAAAVLTFVDVARARAAVTSPPFAPGDMFLLLPETEEQFIPSQPRHAEGWLLNFGDIVRLIATFSLQGASLLASGLFFVGLVKIFRDRGGEQAAPLAGAGSRQ